MLGPEDLSSKCEFTVTRVVMSILRDVRLKLVCASAISVVLASLQAAQQTVVVGTVTLENGSPVKGAVVVFDRLDAKGHRETHTDSQGRYRARGLRLGTYNVYAGVVGLIDKFENYHMFESGSDTLNFILKPPPPTQPPIAAGCITAQEIRETPAGSFLSAGDAPRLEAVVVNACPYLADIWVRLAYYDASGTQIHTSLEHATVAAGTTWSLVHVLPCAELGFGCTPQEWNAHIRIIDVKAYRE